MRRPEIPALTGLRGVAALFVVVNHYAASAAPFPLAEAPTAFSALFMLSGFGMSLFFTLSGFVMYYHYADLPWGARPAFSVLNFFWLRISRLYPVLLLFLFVVTPPALIHSPQGRLWVALHALSLDTLIPVKLLGWLPGDGPLNVSWSIATEIAMYAVFAALMLISAANRLVAMALIASYVGVVLYLMNSPAAEAALAAAFPVIGGPLDSADWARWLWYLSPYYRLLEFGLGAAAAFVLLHHSLERHTRILRRLSGVAVVGLIALHAISFIPGVRPTLLGQQIISACLFVAIILASTQDNRTNRILSSRPLTAIGLASYSLYLFHIFAPGNNLFGTGAPFDWKLVPLMLFNLGVHLMTAVAMAWGMFQLIEKPAQAWLRRVMPFRRSTTTQPEAVAIAGRTCYGAGLPRPVAKTRASWSP